MNTTSEIMTAAVSTVTWLVSSKTTLVPEYAEYVEPSYVSSEYAVMGQLVESTVNKVVTSTAN